jgi:exodeoxyribonuclease V alpha subunit
MIFLQKYHVSPAYAQKIFKIYGNETIERMKANPFHLATHIPGIGFKMADAIAEKMGLPKDAETRIDAAIEYHLSELAAAGHACFPLESFVEKTQTMIDCEIKGRIEALVLHQKIIHNELDSIPYIWSKKLYISEQGIAKELLRLSMGQVHMRAIDSERAIIWAEDKLKISLAEEQKKAVMASFTDKIHIITGGPGTGKSTITKTILEVSARLTSKIILAAPTGRAAKRMSEITKRTASTIHSLLQYDFGTGGFKRGHDLPLECDLIIVDEASMIDTFLMYHLLKAIPDHARIVLVGDINQLPSVGPGNVLKDLIESSQFPVTILKEIFRQAKGSKIITNAHMINEGLFPDLTADSEGDFFFISAEEPEQMLSKIIELLTTRLPKKYHLDPIDQIQVLAPMRRGIIGIDHLNQTLQKVLNPHKEGINVSGIRYLMGDKVMQIRNNYKKEVYNGDIGKVVSVNEEEGILVVRFDNKQVEYSKSELSELVLAYATSIHKYQGSESPCVIIPIHTSHFMMLQKNLLYTGVTRGKKLVILVGAAKAIAMAVANNKASERHTGLKQALHGKMKK